VCVCVCGVCGVCVWCVCGVCVKWNYFVFNTAPNRCSALCDTGLLAQ